MNIVRCKLKGFFLLLILFVMSSCNYYQEFSLPEITTLFPPDRDHIKKIAILPFENLTGNEEVTTMLRKALFSNLILKNYDLIKLSQIERRLEMASYHASDINKISRSKLAEILEADALIYGTVTECTKLYTVVYSRVTVGANVEMVDASDLEVVWRINHVEYSHSGLPPLSPFSIPEKIFESKANLRGKAIENTIYKLAKKMVETLPDCKSTELYSPYNLVINEDAQGFGDENINKFVIDIKDVNNTKEVHYKVQPKDTLYKIAKKIYGHGSGWRNIKDANDKIEASSLGIGCDLILPDVPIITNINEAALLDKERYKKAVYKVKPGDSLYDIASILYKDRDKWEIIYEDNKGIIEDNEVLVADQVLIIPLAADKKEEQQQVQEETILTPQVLNVTDETPLLKSYN